MQSTNKDSETVCVCVHSFI